MKIWGYTKPGPRNVHLVNDVATPDHHLINDVVTPDYHSELQNGRSIETLPAPTVALHVHRESRLEMLQTYSVVEVPPTKEHAYITRTFVDPKTDVVFLGIECSKWFSDLSSRNPDFFDRITAVTISGGYYLGFLMDFVKQIHGPSEDQPDMSMILPPFHLRNLRKLVVNVYGPKRGDSEEFWVEPIRKIMLSYYKYCNIVMDRKSYDKLDVVFDMQSTGLFF